VTENPGRSAVPRPPRESYGSCPSRHSEVSLTFEEECLQRNGFAVLDFGLRSLAERCRQALGDEDVEFGSDGVVRAPFRLKNEVWRELGSNAELLSFVSRILQTRFCLLQQNVITVHARASSSQTRWHRDLPYQTFTTSRAFALNALFVIDEFSCENGATWILPGSHKFETFPGDRFVDSNAVQIEASVGSFLVMDGLVFHSAGVNRSDTPRRAVNHVFGPPLLRSQVEVELPVVNPEFEELLGVEFFAARATARWLGRDNDDRG